MNMTLKRIDYSEDGIFGELLDHNGVFFCHTLERSYKNEKNEFRPKVSEGVYICTRWDSPRLGYQTFLLNNVPNHTHILIHIGNYNEDSDGCILVGNGIGMMINKGKMITGSKQAFKRLMELQNNEESFELEVIDSY